MKCESCGQEIRPIEDDIIDLTNDDEQELVVAPMNIQGQCDCHNEFHKVHGDGHGRCASDGVPENGGICTACLFSCTS